MLRSCQLVHTEETHKQIQSLFQQLRALFHRLFPKEASFVINCKSRQHFSQIILTHEVQTGGQIKPTCQVLLWPLIFKNVKCIKYYQESNLFKNNNWNLLIWNRVILKFQAFENALGAFRPVSILVNDMLEIYPFDKKTNQIDPFCQCGRSPVKETSEVTM